MVKGTGQERVLREKRCDDKSEFKEKSFLGPRRKNIGKTEEKNPNFYIVLIPEPQTEVAHRHMKSGVYIGVLPSA